MKNEKSSRVLYNVIFPIWMLILFPAAWFIVLPANFIIDSLVLIIAAFALKLCKKGTFYIKHILSIYVFGLLSDALGAGFMLLAVTFELSKSADEIYFTIPAVLISAVLIFVFNYFFSFKGIEKTERRKLALTFAIATAPYTFMIPTAWLWN